MNIIVRVQCVTGVCDTLFQDTVEVLLKHKADINARDRHWQTPLHIAAANNAVQCADNLIPLLPNINVTDRGGRTSLHHAAYNGHHEVSVHTCCSHILQRIHKHTGFTAFFTLGGAILLKYSEIMLITVMIRTIHAFFMSFAFIYDRYLLTALLNKP